MAFNADVLYALALNGTEDRTEKNTVCFENDVYSRDGFESSFSWSDAELGIELCPGEKSACRKNNDDRELEDSFEFFLRENKKAVKDKWDDGNYRQFGSQNTTHSVNIPDGQYGKEIELQRNVHDLQSMKSLECPGCKCCSERNLLEDKIKRMMHRLEGRYQRVEDQLAENKILVAEMNRYITFIETQKLHSFSNEGKKLRSKIIELQRELEEKDTRLLELVKLEEKFRRSRDEREHFQNEMITLSRQLEIRTAAYNDLEQRHFRCIENSQEPESHASLKRPISSRDSSAGNPRLTKRLKECESKIRDLEKEKQDLNLRVEVLTDECNQLKYQNHSIEGKLKDAKIHCQHLKSLGDRLEGSLFSSEEDKPSELEKENKYLRNGIGQMERGLHRLMEDFSGWASNGSQNSQHKWRSSSSSKDDDTEKEKQRNIIVAPQTFHITSPECVYFGGTPDASYSLSSMEKDIYERLETEETLTKECSEDI